MTCEQCTEGFSELLAGELAPDQEREMRSHLAGCSDCALGLEQMREVVSLLHQLPEVEPPEQLRGRLAKIAAPVALRFPAITWRVGYAAVGVAAAAAVLLVWMGVSYHAGQSPEQIAQEMPATESVIETRADSREVSHEDIAGDVEMPETAAEPSAEPAIEATLDAPPAPGDSDSPRSLRRSTETEIALAPPPSPAPAASRRPLRTEAPSAARTPEASPVQTQEVAAPQIARAPEEEASDFGRGALPMPRAVYLDEAGGFTQRIGEGTPFTVAVRPPGERLTGIVAPATIVLETEKDVARAQVSVRASDGLELMGLAPDGVIFDGPLKADQETVLSVQMISQAAGQRSITMRVQSTDPLVDTKLEVDMGRFKQLLPPSERPVQFDFEGTPLREAVGSIARASGMQVTVDDAAGNPTVALRMADEIPARAALQMVVDAAGCRLVESDGAFTVKAGETR